MPPPAPKPPGAPITTSAPASVPPAAGVAASAAADPVGGKRAVEKFGPGGRGDTAAIPVPVVNGVDIGAVSKLLFDALIGQEATNTVEKLQALVSAVEALPKSQFPGNKEGRAAWATGNVLKSLLKIHVVGTKSRRVGEPKVRKSATAKFKSAMEMLAQKLGGRDKLAALLGEQYDVEKMLAEKQVAAVSV